MVPIATKNTSNDLGALLGQALIGALIGGQLGNAAPAAAPAKRAFTGRAGYKNVGIISVEEVTALVDALSTGETQTVVVDGRETVIDVLSDEDAATYKGRFRVSRRRAAE